MRDRGSWEYRLIADLKLCVKFAFYVYIHFPVNITFLE